MQVCVNTYTSFCRLSVKRVHRFKNFLYYPSFCFVEREIFRRGYAVNILKRSIKGGFGFKAEFVCQRHNFRIFIFRKRFNELLDSDEVHVIGERHPDKFIKKFAKIELTIPVLIGYVFKREGFVIMRSNVLHDVQQRDGRFDLQIINIAILRNQIAKNNIEKSARYGAVGKLRSIFVKEIKQR